MKKIVRITTIPESMAKLLEGQLGYMSEFYEMVAVSSNENNKLDLLGEKENIKTYATEFTRKITPVKDLKALYNLYKILKKEKPEIVHTHTPKAGTVGMLAAKLAGVPVRMHTIAGLPLLEATGFKRKLLSSVEKMTYACATKIYPNSFVMKDIILEEKFTTSNKLKVLANGSSNGINIKHFSKDNISLEEQKSLKKSLGISEENITFVFVGRMVKDKGVNELVASFIKLNEENPLTKLLLVGPLEKDLDPLNQETEKHIESHPNIKWVGFQKDVRPYFAISDVLAFPSYREGFPNVVLQAGAMELPSIVSDINGCNEIIINNKNGIIIPPKDEDQLYKAMLEMAQNNNLRDQLKQNARLMIQDRYQQELVWKALLEEYQLLIKNLR
ncbi:glycosyltransferase family 4 protein [Aureivirga marina]|uniref:glycosyltransferase family 4 protein n=1 Tax=Aureivirga marina TaxID=1182451 RepID=UPI0018C9F011|nr:glycosyltransferase family 4 protein [Aureivirga marina]